MFTTNKLMPLVALLALVSSLVFALASSKHHKSLEVDQTEFLASCTPAQEAKVAQDLSPVGACVLNQAQAGADPTAVLGACAGTTIEAVVQIVETFLAAKPQLGPAMAAQHDQLAAFLTKAKALQASGAK